MKIAICDDLASERLSLIECLRRLEEDRSLEIEITEYTSPVSLIDAPELLSETDILFMDIYMPQMTGTDAVRTLRDQGYTGSVIFCTTSEDHAVESYRLKADGYLVKPYRYEDFLEAIWRLDELFHDEVTRTEFISDRISYNIPIKDILFIETENKGCRVHCANETLFTWKKIGAFEDEVTNESSFYKIGRCYLVNLNQIDKLREEDLLMKDGCTIPYPSREGKKIRQHIKDYYWQMTRGLS